ncbi:YkgJ family cysteine cluster protein [Sediminibacillus dalangtanensis]|uniref:YkgJ family cysteine cluster protein n=1 Tax=Sediminibacillus dalangtanensis TaxID=2729421 RepID=A0ABX7VU15_9BACI|nr:YkgJ family cysteine cluster protein [Sediminibacillus dalangtanensis]QTM99095.1 YkgJ family cysteine cluster protein [Sediminibacillus dalangtanensis]
MGKYLSYKEIQTRCGTLQEKYQIEEERFYDVVEIWAESNLSPKDKLLGSFHELLRIVSKEIDTIENTLELEASCRMGCAFCCYYPIIINKMEAKLMRQAMAVFPEQRRNKLHAHFHHYFQEYGKQLEDLSAIETETDREFKLAYRKKQLPCVMLDTETNQCMAYEIRPIPCRTYVNYADPKVCQQNLMPKETVSFEFLYGEYMGALNEFLQFLYEEEDTAFIDYPNDLYTQDYLFNWFKDDYRV